MIQTNEWDKNVANSELSNDGTQTSKVDNDGVVENGVVETSSDSSVRDKSDSVKKPASGDDDYKAKLAENRRLARERAEREAAEERQREEERRYYEVDFQVILYFLYTFLKIVSLSAKGLTDVSATSLCFLNVTYSIYQLIS